MASDAEIQALQHNVAAIKKRLDYIEEHLVQLSNSGIGAGYAPSTADIPAEVLELARAGKRLDALKKYRELTNASMDQAQDVISGI